MRWAVAILLMIFGASIDRAATRAERPFAGGAARRRASGQPAYAKQIKPLLSKYCYDCHGHGKHKGDLALDAYPDEASILKDRKRWEMVLKNVRGAVMPPEKKPQPSPEERELMANWIESEIFQCDCDHPDPGRVTLRRLNRVEYNNTIRDLVGVNFQPADGFPADDVGYGFDNIGDVLSLSPLLLEKYVAAAGKILTRPSSRTILSNTWKWWRRAPCHRPRCRRATNAFSFACRRRRMREKTAPAGSSVDLPNALSAGLSPAKKWIA